MQECFLAQRVVLVGTDVSPVVISITSFSMVVQSLPTYSESNVLLFRLSDLEHARVSKQNGLDFDLTVIFLEMLK